MFAEDRLVTKSSVADVENETILGFDGASVTNRMGLDDQVHEGHLLFVWEQAEHHKRGARLQVLLVQMRLNAFDV